MRIFQVSLGSSVDAQHCLVPGASLQDLSLDRDGLLMI